MSRWRKKPVVIEATQWRKMGDHDAVGWGKLWGENTLTCKACRGGGGQHGWIDTLEGGHPVCPGDWIIGGVQGELYPCKPDIFEKTYEPVK